MPKISKIRIVNIYYNNGNRIIPDELYNLYDEEQRKAVSTLFNLQNGGGKTVLVQMMMQPVLPHAKASDRRIEGYFQKSTDHGYVVLEWTKDGTENERLLTGISMAGSQNASESDSGRSIRFYNFMTEYSDDSRSPYDIASLELSSKINGRFKAAEYESIRNLSKKSGGKLITFSSDSSNEWEKKLAEFGILKSEWRDVIEVLNKKEGGLSSYFEEAKTSDKLIRKFFLPAIDSKIEHIGTDDEDSSLETMLINYSKKITQKEETIKRAGANKKILLHLNALKEKDDALQDLSHHLSEVTGQAVGFKMALVSDRKNSLEEIENEKSFIENRNLEKQHIDFEEKSEDYYRCSDALEEKKANYYAASEEKRAADSEVERLTHEQDLLLGADLRDRISAKENTVKGLSEKIKMREQNLDEANKIKSLKYSIFVSANKELSEKEETEKELAKEKSDIEKELSKLVADISATEKEKERFKETADKAEAITHTLEKENDAFVEKYALNELQRDLEKHYSDSEIGALSQESETHKNTIERKIRQIHSDIRQNEVKVEELHDQEKVLSGELEGIKRDIKDSENALEAYQKQKAKVQFIADKFGIKESGIFDGELRTRVENEIKIKDSEKNKFFQNKNEYDDRLHAAENGSLHLTKDVFDYISKSRIEFTTGEKYLSTLKANGSLSAEAFDDLLENYPVLAYAIIFNSESDMKKFVSEVDEDSWLSSAVPLFTMQEFSAFLNDSAPSGNFLARYDKSFFANPSDYIERIGKKIAEFETKINLCESQLAELQSDIEIIHAFDFSASYEEELMASIADLKKTLSEKEKAVEAIKSERAECRDKGDGLQSKQKQKENDLVKQKAFISDLNEFVIRYKEECENRDSWYENDDKCKEKIRKLDALTKEKEEKTSSLNDIAVKLETVSKAISELQGVISEMDHPIEAEIVDDAWRNLFVQYKEIIKNKSADLDSLRKEIEDAEKEISDLKLQLSSYHIDETELTNIEFSIELLNKVRNDLAEAAKFQKEKTKAFSSSEGDLKVAESDFKKALKKLEQYGNEPLPKTEIKGNYEERLRKIEKELSDAAEKISKLSRRADAIQDIIDELDEEIDIANVNTEISEITLEPDFKSQWKGIRTSFREYNKKLTDMNNSVITLLQEIISEHDAWVLDEIYLKFQSLKNTLSQSGNDTNKFYVFSKGIASMTDSILKINSKYETDLNDINNEYKDLVNQCVIKAGRIYEDLNSIAASSRVHLNGNKNLTQIVKFVMPAEKEISEEACRVAIEEEIKYGAEEIKKLINDPEKSSVQIKNRAQAIVSSEKLLHCYIGKDNIPVSVYKIDNSIEHSGYKRWEEALTQNSGAERFVICFTLILTLMNYSRSKEGMFANTNNASGVLILDNPFGEITTAYLLEPVFEIAEHFNVQLICLTALKDVNIRNSFSNVIKLFVRSQSLSDKEILTHEGNELIDHGFYKVMNKQISLFSS